MVDWEASYWRSYLTQTVPAGLNSKVGYGQDQGLGLPLGLFGTEQLLFLLFALLA